MDGKLEFSNQYNENIAVYKITDTQIEISVSLNLSKKVYAMELDQAKQFRDEITRLIDGMDTTKEIEE